MGGAVSSTGSCTGPALKRRWLQVRRRKVEAELGLAGREKRAGGWAELKAIRRKDQKRGAGSRFPRRAVGEGQGPGPRTLHLTGWGRGPLHLEQRSQSVPTLPAETATHLAF